MSVVSVVPLPSFSQFAHTNVKAERVQKGWVRRATAVGTALRAIYVIVGSENSRAHAIIMTNRFCQGLWY